MAAMQCQFCQNKATVFLTQLVEGQMQKIALCEKCAAEKGVTDPTGFSLADMLLGGGFAAKPVSTTEMGGGAGIGGKACPNCGFTLEDLKRVRRFGCSECYETFREEVNAMIRGIQKGPEHHGKVPKGLLEAHERSQRLEQLRERLDQAVAAENYEEAAGLRDEIRKVQGNAGAS